MNVKFICIWALAILFAGAGATKAQEKTDYIIVKTTGGEVASFYPEAVKRQFVENGNWVFELNNSQKYTYPLAEVLPFTTELRNVNSGTGNQPVTATPDWRVYDDGSALIIENLGRKVGRYAVYNLSGRLLKSGYEDGEKVSVAVPSGGMYIVKAGMKVKKAIKK